MNPSRDALLGRFRASLQQRVKNLRALMEVLEYVPSDPEAIRQVQAELHTLKGESRMLGMSSLSELSHALEEHLDADAAIDFSRIGLALDAMRRALDEDTPADMAERNLERTFGSLFPQTHDEGPKEPKRESVPQVDPESRAPREPHRPDGENPTEGRAKQRWVQVNASLVDELCDQVSDLAVQLGRLEVSVNGALRGSVSETSRAGVKNQLTQCRELLDRSVDRTWSLRLVPIEPMLRELEQHAKVLARRIGKEIDVQVSSGGVQLERDVVDQVWDSLLHLVQNSIAHGLELPDERGEKTRRGSLCLTAASAGSTVVISVEDDGSGIDPNVVRSAALARGVLSRAEAEIAGDERIVQLVFERGFSTEEEVDELSGRGIGLDVVKAKIEALGGSVQLHTQMGRGTSFRLRVPFAITKERVLIVELDATLYGIPSRVVHRVLGPGDLAHSVGGQRDVVQYQGELLPLWSLASALRVNEPQEESALILHLGDRPFGVRVPHIVGEHDLIRRPADPLLSSTTGIGASAMMDDGRLVLLLEFGFLEKLLGPVHPGAMTQRATSDRAPARTRVLVVDDSPVVTAMVAEILTGVGLLVEIANDGEEALSAIRRSEPDLVLSDVEMPRMGGFDLLQAIRDRSQTLPVIMLTTRGSVEDRQRASSLGANAYVLKSGFKSDVLLEVVGRFLRIGP